MLKRKTFLKKKASRDISASRNLRLRRLKHRKAKQFQRHALQLVIQDIYKKGEHHVRPFNVFIILYFSKESFKRSSARRDSPLC